MKRFILLLALVVVCAFSAEAGFRATNLVGFGGAQSGGTAASFSFLGSADCTSADPYTESGASLGTAASDRMIIVATGNEDTTVSSITVGGNSATLMVDNQSDNAPSGLWIVNVTSGTTGDIVVDKAANQRCAIAWGAAYGIGTSTTPDDTATFTTDSTPQNITTLTTNVDGLAVFAVTVHQFQDTSIDQSVTEHVEQSLTGGELYFGSKLTTAAETPTFAVTSTSLNRWSGSAAAFGPE